MLMTKEIGIRRGGSHFSIRGFEEATMKSTPTAGHDDLVDNAVSIAATSSIGAGIVSDPARSQVDPEVWPARSVKTGVVFNDRLTQVESGAEGFNPPSFDAAA